MGGEANKMPELDYDLLGHTALNLGPFFKLNTNVWNDQHDL